jgi:DNA repair protein RadC
MARRALAQQLRSAGVRQPAGRSRTTCSCTWAGARTRCSRAVPGQPAPPAQLEELFRGTLTQTSVYPREVVQARAGAQRRAVVLAHNHPSGVAEPSRADEFLTQTLKSALALVDVRVLDHLVVGRGQVVSMAERGLL